MSDSSSNGRRDGNHLTLPPDEARRAIRERRERRTEAEKARVERRAKWGPKKFRKHVYQWPREAYERLIKHYEDRQDERMAALLRSDMGKHYSIERKLKASYEAEAGGDLPPVGDDLIG